MTQDRLYYAIIFSCPITQSLFSPLMARLTTAFSSCSIAMLALWTSTAAIAASPAHSTTQTGMASWYGGTFFQSKKTAQGQRFDRNALTAAHKTLPFGTKVLVQSPKTHRSVVVTINDRGPFSRHRVIDLSRKAAEKLDIVQHGVVPVSLTVLKTGTSHPKR